MIRPTMRSIFSLVISWGIVMILLGASPGTAAKHNLRIQALIPQMNDVFSSDGVIPAMNMAVDDINANESLLSDYTLFTKISNTKCDAPEGTWQLIRSVLDTDQSDETKIIVYLGGACSLATEPTAALTGRLYKVVQVCWYNTYTLPGFVSFNGAINLIFILYVFRCRMLLHHLCCLIDPCIHYSFVHRLRNCSSMMQDSL
jgi:hypothetical protein